MKAVTSTLFLSLMLTNPAHALMSSTINLPGGGDVQPTKSVSIPLTNLIPSTIYKISCTIDAKSNDQIVRLSFDCGGIPGSCEVFNTTVNGDGASQGLLKQGANSASFTGSFSATANANITFTNLDQQNRINVNNCSATAVVI